MARVLQLTLVFFGSVSVVYFILSVISDFARWGRYAAQGGILAVFTFVGLAGLRRGYFRLVSIVEILVIWLVFTYAAYTGGGVRSSGYFGYLVVLVAVGVIAGKRLDTAAMAFLCAAAGYFLVYAEAYGFLPHSRVPMTPFSIWLDSLVYFTVVAGLLILTMRVTHSAFQRLGAELTERRRVEARELARREMLEKVIRLGKTVTEAEDYQTVLLKIWSGVRSSGCREEIGALFGNLL